MPAFAAPRPASATPCGTPTKTTAGGIANNSRTRPRSAVPPMSAPPKMRSPSVASSSSSSSSVASAASQANREWELDRIRRLLYEQECTQLKGRLEEKETEIETIRQEKTRITKSFWEGRTRAMALLQTLTRKREELARARGQAAGRKAASFFSSFASSAPASATSHATSADGSAPIHPPAAAAVPAGEDSDLQTLQALTTIITELGNVSSESGSSSSITSGEKQDGQLSTSVASAAPDKTEQTGEQQPAAAEAPAAAAATAAAPACCSKCQGPLAAVEEPTTAIATTTEAETQTQTTAVAEAVAPPSQQQQQPQGEEMEKEKEFDLDLFKLKRQAAKLRDELAKKRFAEMALDVRLKETEEEAARLAEELRGREAMVESLRLELEEKDARLMDFVSRVHDIEVRLGKVALERDERRAEAEAAVEAVRFYQAKEEGGGSPSVSPTAGVEETKCGAGGHEQQQGQQESPKSESGGGSSSEEEDPEVAKALAAKARLDAANKLAPSPSPSHSTSPAASSPPAESPSLGSVQVEVVEAATAVGVGEGAMEDDDGHQALRALHTPLERLVEEAAAFVHKHHDSLLAPMALAFAAAVALGLTLLILRAALAAPPTPKASSSIFGDGTVVAAAEDPWMGARRSPLFRLTPGGAPLLAGEYLASCPATPEAEAEAEADKNKPCYFLWNQWDGNLVLYRGLGPAKHRGPLWSTNTLVRLDIAAGGREQQPYHWGAANVTVSLTQDRALQLVDAPSGKLMWQRRAWRLPRELTPWPFGR